MIKQFQKAIRDITHSQDGSVSLTKLAAATAHANAAALFVWLNITQEPKEWLWLTYLGATVSHAVADKSVKIYQSIKQGEAPANASNP